MTISRRQFAQLSGSAAISGRFAQAQKAPITVNQMVERIKQNLGVQLGPDTVDKFKAGNPEVLVKGVTTTFMATLDVLQRSVAAGANFIITHEPTFWNHLDVTDAWRDDPVFQFKTAFIEKHGLVVWRLHDGAHARKPDMIFVGWSKALGWEKYQVDAKGPVYVVPPTTVEAIARHFAERLKTRSIRLMGDPRLKATRVAVGGHNALDRQGMTPECDVLVLFEAWERDSAEYIRDAILSGQKKALILTAHVCGEESGMEECARWLRTFLTEVPIHFVPARDKFWIPA